MKTCPTCGRLYMTPKDFLRGTYRWRLSEKRDLYFNCSCGSTMLLPEGKYDWYSPGLLMSELASSVFNSFASPDSLPYLPSVAIELMEALSNEHTSIAQIGAICRRDPTLAAQILTTANAARNPGSLIVSKIEQAIGLLGRYRVATLCQAAALSLFETRTTEYTKAIHFLEAFTTGLVAERLAALLAPELSTEVAYICGSFCNVGKLLGAILFPDLTDRIYERVNRLNDPKTWTAVEDMLGAPGHTILGEIACVLWGMPEEIFGVVLDHHKPLAPTPPDRSPVSHKLCAIVTFANQISHRLMLNSHRVDENILAGCVAWFGLSESTLDDLVESLRPATEHSRTYLEAI